MGALEGMSNFLGLIMHNVYNWTLCATSYAKCFIYTHFIIYNHPVWLIAVSIPTVYEKWAKFKEIEESA